MDSSLELTPLKIPSLLREFNLKPQKGLGQNFLIDPIALEHIVDASGVTEDSFVLEIGPGLGSLTRYLAQRAKQVVAVELDQHILPALESVLAPWDNVRIIQGDILDLDPADIMQSSPYQVVANIPYYITSALIRHLLESALPPKQLVLTVQQEVADRICATKKLSLLALSIQVYGKPASVVRIPAGAFYPAPKVDSKCVRIDLYDEPLIPREQLDTFFKLAKAGFSQKRKTLTNALSGRLGLPKDQVKEILTGAQIDPMRRAETLKIAEWRTLTGTYLQRS